MIICSESYMLLYQLYMRYRISSIKRPGRLFVETIFRGPLNRGGRLFEGGRLLKNQLFDEYVFKSKQR